MTITRLKPRSVGKIAGPVTLIGVAVFALPAALVSLAVIPVEARQYSSYPVLFLLLLPFGYGGFAFVIGWLYANVYNVVSRWIGGIEIEVSSSK